MYSKYEQQRKEAEDYRNQASQTREQQNKNWRENGYSERSTPFYSSECKDDGDYAVKQQLKAAEQAEASARAMEREAKQARKELERLRDEASRDSDGSESRRWEIERAEKRANSYEGVGSKSEGCCVM